MKAEIKLTSLNDYPVVGTWINSTGSVSLCCDSLNSFFPKLEGKDKCTLIISDKYLRGGRKVKIKRGHDEGYLDILYWGDGRDMGKEFYQTFDNDEGLLKFVKEINKIHIFYIKVKDIK